MEDTPKGQKQKRKRFGKTRAWLRGGLTLGEGAGSLASALSVHALPALIHVLPHSPQLFARLVGLVVNRHADEASKTDDGEAASRDETRGDAEPR